MTSIEALILGLVQGLTEFFPVSSSLHLKLTSKLLGINSDPTLFLFCHLATSFSVIFYFRKDIYSLFIEKKKELFLYAAALLPLVVIYLFFGSSIKKVAQYWMGPFLICTSFLLFFLKEKKEHKPPSFRRKITDVLLIGSAQSLALMPGLSRSATTLFAATKRGWTLRQAFCFSYLLSIPTIWGGCLLEFSSVNHNLINLPILLAFFSSFFVGCMGLYVVDVLIQKKKYFLFGFYCLFLGCSLTFYSFFGNSL